MAKSAWVEVMVDAFQPHHPNHAPPHHPQVRVVKSSWFEGMVDFALVANAAMVAYQDAHSEDDRSKFSDGKISVISREILSFIL